MDGSKTLEAPRGAEVLSRKIGAMTLEAEFAGALKAPISS